MLKFGAAAIASLTLTKFPVPSKDTVELKLKQSERSTITTNKYTIKSILNVNIIVESDKQNIIECKRIYEGLASSLNFRK